MIFKYQKYIDPIITREIKLPMNEMEFVGTELATVDGFTYVYLPDGFDLPDNQPAEIAASISPVTLDPVLREAIKVASPHCKLIERQMIEKIRSQYSIDDEMYFARIGVGAATGLYSPTSDEMQAMTVFGEFVEGVRQWGRSKRAEIGL